MAGETALKPVVMEGMRIVFRNFAGKEGQYNREGDRNFGVILPPDVAEQMLADGWNVKYLKPREEDEDGEETPWLSVSVNFDKGRPPTILMITSRGKTKLDEDNVEQLDWVDIAQDENGQPKVDLIVRPYHWDVSGRSGIKAYLQSMYVTIDEDDLARKYAELDSQ
jgi:hypothetical protein